MGEERESIGIYYTFKIEIFGCVELVLNSGMISAMLLSAVFLGTMYKIFYILVVYKFLYIFKVTLFFKVHNGYLDQSLMRYCHVEVNLSTKPNFG